MGIKFSNHLVESKLLLLKESGFNITTEKIKEAMEDYDKVDMESDAPKVIVTKKYDDKHDLKVVYKLDAGIMKVLTVYPAER